MKLYIVSEASYLKGCCMEDYECLWTHAIVTTSTQAAQEQLRRLVEDAFDTEYEDLPNEFTDEERNGLIDDIIKDYCDGEYAWEPTSHAWVWRIIEQEV